MVLGVLAAFAVLRHMMHTYTAGHNTTANLDPEPWFIVAQ